VLTLVYFAVTDRGNMHCKISTIEEQTDYKIKKNLGCSKISPFISHAHGTLLFKYITNT